MVERIIIPKYKTLSIESIDSYVLTRNREYDVRFYTTKKIPPEVQEEIDTEVKTLFKNPRKSKSRRDKTCTKSSFILAAKNLAKSGKRKSKS